MRRRTSCRALKPRPSLRVAVSSTLRRRVGCERWLRGIAERVARACGFADGMLSVAIVGRKRMRRLNREHLGHDFDTDVLSFDLGCDPRAGRIEGEIVVSFDMARRVARRRARSDAELGRELRRELALYVTHGILHLAGYDDAAPEAARRMHAREDELLTALGLGPVYSEEG